MTDHPTDADMLNKAEREAAYWREQAEAARMTLRDTFAAAVAPAIITARAFGRLDCEGGAALCFDLADAMMAERDKAGEP
jgi:hypothetical protein